VNRRTIVLFLWLVMCGVVNVSGQNHAQTVFLVPIKLYSEHLIVVRGNLGNLTERNLLIDTGAYPSAIDREVAHELKLKINRGESRALGHNIQAGAAIIPEIEIGPLRAPGLPVVVEDLYSISKVLGVRIDALIGLDVLARASFQIDYTKKELSFGPPEQLAFAVPIVAERAMALVAMNIDSHVVHLLIDTGAARTVLFAQRVPSLGSKPEAELRFTSLSGRLALNGIKANDAELGGIRLDSRSVFLSDGSNMTGMPFDGLLATWTEHIHRISFDFEHNVFSWEMEATTPVRQVSAPQTMTAAAGNASYSTQEADADQISGATGSR
jgi:predicted aspartyl protease